MSINIVPIDDWLKRLEDGHEYYTGQTCPCHEGMPFAVKMIRTLLDDKGRRGNDG